MYSTGMKDLHIFDCSNYISAGGKFKIAKGVIECAGKYRPCELPVGGVQYLLNSVVEYYIGHEQENDVVYCFDRPPEFKRTLYTRLIPQGKGYKGNRPEKDRSIPIQRSLAENILKLCGLNVLAVENYEADDVVASVCKYYKDSYKHVYIHTLDSDLAYLVDDTVSVVPLSEERYRGTGKWITRANWEYTVKASQNMVIPYNSLLLDKLYVGESGDNIPSCSDDMRNKLKAGIHPKLYPHFSNPDLLLAAVQKYSDFDEYTVGLMELLIPVILPEHDVQLYDEEFNRDLFIQFCVALRMYKFRNVKDKRLDIVEDLLERYFVEYNQ